MSQNMVLFRSGNNVTHTDDAVKDGGAAKAATVCQGSEQEGGLNRV